MEGYIWYSSKVCIYYKPTDKGTLGFLGDKLATLEQYVQEDKLYNNPSSYRHSIFEALEPYDVITLAEGNYQLNSNLHIDFKIK